MWREKRETEQDKVRHCSFVVTSNETEQCNNEINQQREKNRLTWKQNKVKHFERK